MSEKGIDYVLSKSMKKNVTGISDIVPLQEHVIVLNNRTNNPNLINIKEKHKNARKSRKYKWLSMSTRSFRKKNEKIKKANLTYEKFNQISDLWKEYSDRVGTNEQNVAGMDFHGATITVTVSPDPGLIGLKGRIVKETYNSLIIISEDNKVRQINKNHNVIELETNHGRFEINLTTLRCHPYLKATKKWKQRAPLPLPY